MEEDAVPRECKRAKVMPIFNEGGWEIAMNNTPVSLMSKVYKMLKKIMRKQT